MNKFLSQAIRRAVSEYNPSNIQNNTDKPVELLAIICPSKTSEELLSEK